MTAADLPKPSLTLTGRFEKDHERRYAHVPFEVPAGLRQLHIRYSYSDQIDSDPLIGGGNTLDIGLFDERGIAEGSPGFRGWSGSNKMELTIDEAWATPPYRAGRIGAGTWHVLLGPYKVGPRGCDWTVEIWFDPGLPTPKQLFHAGVGHNPSLPPKRSGWLRGDLHCHTLFSDGDSWPIEMLEAASAAGLDFLGVTDHNNVAHHAAYGPGGRGGEPLVIPGVEVTTYGGHWNAWGTDRWWEFREPESDAVERTMRAAMASGAVVSICHPKPFGPPWEYENDGGFHAIEVWNGPWAQLNAASLARWEGLLRRGVRCVAVGGSDTHYLHRRDVAPRHADSIGTPTTWVHVEGVPTVAAILAALRDGRSFVSESPRGPQVYLDADRGRAGRISIETRDAGSARLEVFTAVGSIASKPATGDPLVFEIPSDARFVRAQLVGENGDVRALTNPLWLDRW
ncbi:MAG TPA: CehA/McbA family metallohydrolase [Candidatus Polarisedimenticolia bacterium]|nr:CehA/McbA family metallohydrolase [Candidatus Polarisedimenticolia bacterium]